MTVLLSVPLHSCFYVIFNRRDAGLEHFFVDAGFLLSAFFLIRLGEGVG